MYFENVFQIHVFSILPNSVKFTYLNLKEKKKILSFLFYVYVLLFNSYRNKFNLVLFFMHTRTTCEVIITDFCRSSHWCFLLTYRIVVVHIAQRRDKLIFFSSTSFWKCTIIQNGLDFIHSLYQQTLGFLVQLDT